MIICRLDGVSRCLLLYTVNNMHMKLKVGDLKKRAKAAKGKKKVAKKK